MTIPFTLRRATLALATALGLAACSGSPDDAITDTSADDLALGKLSSRYGASGDVTSPPSSNIFGDLYSRGLTRVREVTYLSYGRGPAVASAVGALAGKVDVFVSVFVAECGQSGSGCTDLWAGDATSSSDKPAIKNAFKAHFQAVVDAVNPVYGQARDVRVRTWAVNEPDNAMAKLGDWPERAALFYLGAREVLNATSCANCTLVAGEFAGFNSSKVNDFHRYVHELHTDGQYPTVFSLHPYGDVDHADAQNWKTTHAAETDLFEQTVANVHPHAEIWLTEVGRTIHDSWVSHSQEDEWASGIYVRRRLAHHPRVARVYWYQMAAGASGWDSALADKEGRRRAMFFGLMGDSKEEALKKAAADHSNPAPDH